MALGEMAIEFDPHSVSASPSHLSPDRRGRGNASIAAAPFLSPVERGEVSREA